MLQNQKPVVYTLKQKARALAEAFAIDVSYDLYEYMTLEVDTNKFIA